MDRFSRFTILINKIVRNIHRIKVEEMSRFGLKGTHVSCLYYLYREEKPLTASELTAICDEDKAAVSRAIDYLSKEGYVVCEGAALKKYKSPVVLTQKGMEVSKSIAARVDSILDAASEGLSDEDRAVFYKGLDLVSDNLQKMRDGKV